MKNYSFINYFFMSENFHNEFTIENFTQTSPNKTSNLDKKNRKRFVS